MRDMVLGEGKIEAPDHKPIEVVGPHLLGQTEFLYNPPEAD